MSLKKEEIEKVNIGMFYSRDGSKFYVVGIGEIWEYALSRPFAYWTGVYIGRQELIR